MTIVFDIFFRNGDAENDDSQSDIDEDEVIDEEDGEHHKGTNLGLDNANTIAQMTNGILDISIFSWEDDKKQNGSALDGTAENCDYHRYITTNSEKLVSRNSLMIFSYLITNLYCM